MDINQPASPLRDTEKEVLAMFSMNLAQSAGTYNLFTASGGDVVVTTIDFYVSVAGVGFVSVASATNDTTPVVLMASAVLAAITIGANLTPFSTRVFLASSKSAQYTIVGTGSAGTIKCAVKYRPTVQGALIS